MWYYVVPQGADLHLAHFFSIESIVQTLDEFPDSFFFRCRKYRFICAPVFHVSIIPILLRFATHCISPFTFNMYLGDCEGLNIQQNPPIFAFKPLEYNFKALRSYERFKKKSFTQKMYGNPKYKTIYPKDSLTAERVRIRLFADIRPKLQKAYVLP
jgi:hypothetical protein